VGLTLVLPSCLERYVFSRAGQRHVVRATLVNLDTGARERVDSLSADFVGTRRFETCNSADPTADAARGTRDFARFVRARLQDLSAPGSVRMRFGGGRWCLAQTELVESRSAFVNSDFCGVAESTEPVLEACPADIPRPCSGLSAPPGTPEIAVSETRVDFGPRPVGSATPLVRSLTVSNSGGGLLCLDGYGLDPLARATQDFTVMAGTCRPQTPDEMTARRVALGATTRPSCTLEVSYTPRAAGPRTSSLAFFSNAASQPGLRVPLAGVGLAGAVALAPAPACFNVWPTSDGSGGFERRQTVTLTNVGAGALTVMSAALPMADTPNWAVVSTTPGPLPQTLGPGATLTLVLRTRTRDAATTQLTITTDGVPSNVPLELLPPDSGCTP
jgi:hypothetical protein